MKGRTVERGEKFIFVGGVPRSGTTLVQNILDSHPDICGIPEFFHLSGIVNLRRSLRYDIQHGMIDLICSLDDIDHYLCTLIENLFFPLMEQHRCRLSSEKTPHNVLVFPELIEMFPGAHFIHVVRDPRAVIASLFEVHKRAKEKGKYSPFFSKSIREAIKFTQKCLDLGFTAYRKTPDKVLIVVYERLVRQSEQEAKKICQFLNIEWSERMLYPSRVKHLGEKSITSEHNSAWYDKQMFNRDPVAESIDQWKRRLTFVQQIRITHAFKDCQDLLDLGYDFSLDHLSVSQKLYGSFQSVVRAKIGDMRLLAGRSLRRLLPA